VGGAVVVSHARHHRRRRAVAALTLLVAIVVALVAALSGGGATHRLATPPSAGFFSEIGRLAGGGRGSLVSFYEEAETDAIKRTLSYTPYVRIAGNQHREVALTFDDGPGPYTPQVLDVLERDHAPGTFFQVGVLQQYFHASTSRIVADGFPIGDHTWSHAPMSQLPRSEQQSQLLQQAAAIHRYGASFPRLFRPPYGDFNATTLALLAKYRMLMVLWTVDTSDYRLPGVQAIVDAAVGGARPGSIILMHDAGGNRAETVAALPIIIKDLRARGYKLVTVPRLLLDNPPPRVQNIAAVINSGGG
jgi:peptidoglycan/xylan/chitin deacetylase (PgdA/CDA1 family)